MCVEGLSIGAGDAAAAVWREAHSLGAVAQSGSPSPTCAGDVERFRVLAENAAVHVWSLDAGGHVEYANPHSLAYFGRSLEELASDGWESLVHPDDLPKMQAAWIRASEGGEPGEEEFRLRRHDGCYSWFLGLIAPVKWAEGPPIRWVGVCAEITRQKEAEKALRLAEAQYRTLAEHSPDVIARFDRDLRHLYVSPAIQAATGLAPETFLGKTNEELGMPPDLARHWRDGLRQVLDTGKPTTLEYRFDGPSGSNHYECKLVPEMGADGTVQSVLGINRDITDRVLAERALRESEERFRVLADESPMHVWSMEPDGTIDYANARACAYLGMTLEEQRAASWEVQIHPDDVPALRAAWVDASRTGEPGKAEYRVRRHDGTYRWFWGRMAPLFDEVGRLRKWVGVSADITDRRREEERAQFLARAGEALAGSLDYRTTLDQLAHLAVPLMADWCLVHFAGDETVDGCTATAHVDRGAERTAREVARQRAGDIGSSEPYASILATRRSFIAPEVTPGLLDSLGLHPDQAALYAQLGPRSAMAVALTARGRILGVMSFAMTTSGRCYGPADLALAEELGRRAALAVDNALLFRQAEAARRAAERAAERISALQAVTAALSAAPTPGDVAAVVIEQAVPALGASAATLALLTPDGKALQVVQASGYHPDVMETWRRFALDAQTPMGDAVRTGRAVLLPSIEAWDAYPEAMAAARACGHHAAASVPLVVEGKAIGGIGLSFDQPREFDADDLGFMAAIGTQAAQALRRARILEDAEHARRDALEANAAKDQFVALVTHELRNPMNTIQTGLFSLRRRLPPDERIQRTLDTVEQSAALQARLINDLLDLSRLKRGKLRLHQAPMALDQAAQMAIRLCEGDLEDAGLTLEVEIEPGVCVVGDHDRLQQVVVNLLSNAVKFTPPGGRVRVAVGVATGDQRPETKDQRPDSASPVPGPPSPVAAPAARVVVEDTGVGISPEVLPRLFDLYEQGEAASGRAAGLGIGLALVRSITEMHGGRVWAESQGVGMGSRFVVELPLAPPEADGARHTRSS